MNFLNIADNVYGIIPQTNLEATIIALSKLSRKEIAKARDFLICLEKYAPRPLKPLSFPTPPITSKERSVAKLFFPDMKDLTDEYPPEKSSSFVQRRNQSNGSIWAIEKISRWNASAVVNGARRFNIAYDPKKLYRILFVRYTDGAHQGILESDQNVTTTSVKKYLDKHTLEDLAKNERGFGKVHFLQPSNIGELKYPEADDYAKTFWCYWNVEHELYEFFVLPPRFKHY